MRTSCSSATLCLLGALCFLPALVSAQETNDSWSMTTTDRLRASLFVNYDKSAHPMATATQRSNITVGMSINYIDIDELEGKMTLHALLNVRWKDAARTWSPESFDNISTLHVRSRDVWRPDITLFNSAGREGDFVGDTQTLLTSDGSFLWVPPVEYIAYCNLNLRMWPFDSQTCKLRVGTWSLTNIDTRFESVVDTNEGFFKSPEWEIIDVRAQYESEEFYNYIEYTFQIKRSSSMYSAVIFTPASCIVLLSLSIFWLPPQMGEKILLNAVVLVIVAAFLMYFAQMLPILAENTPLIVLFYSSSLLLLSLSTIISVFVLYLSTSKHKQRVPDIFRKTLNGLVGRLLLLGEFTLEAEPHSLLNNGTKELGEHVYESADQLDSASDAAAAFNAATQPSDRSIQFDWILLATAFDRIWFIIYSLIFIVLAIVYSV